MRWKWKRPAAFLLAAAMIFTMPGVPASAVEAGVSAVHTGVCKHHPEHTEDCGYTEGTEGAACEHEHTEDCYTLVKKCIHEHDESCYPVLEGSVLENTATPSEAEEAQPTACTHECSEESGCITKELSCPHERGEHDDTCGYIPATEGTPCGYICELCNSQDSGLVPGVSGNAPAECICETRCEKEAVNPDCPVCAAEDADLSACLGKEAALPLMAAAASTEKTISGEVTWNNQTFTTPVKLTGDTTLTLEGDNKIECDAPLDLNNCSLTVKGTGTLTVVGNGRSDNRVCNGAIFDSGYKGTTYGTGTLTLEGGTVTASGGDYNAISVRFVKLQGGKLEAYGGSRAGIVCSYLYTYGGSLYATGDVYGIELRTTYADNPGNLAILASDEKGASMAKMDEGNIRDIKNNAKKKTYYIGEVTGPLFSVETQKGTLYEGVAAQKATFAISAKNVDMTTLKAQWVGDHTGLTESLSTDGKTLTVTTDATVKQGTYSLIVTVTGTDATTVTKTVMVTVSGSPITISTQPQDVSDSCKGGDLDAWQGDKGIRVTATLATGQIGDISYQWKLEDGTELEGFTRSTLSLKELYNAGKLSPVADKLWLSSAKVYCTLTYGSCSVNTNTVTLTVNTCTHEKYTNEGKCQQCGEPCSKDVLFIRNGIPYTFEGDNPEVGFILFSGGTAYFVRDTDATLKAGNGDTADKRDVTLDLQGHRVKALDLQNCPYNSVTIKNGTIEGIDTKDPAVLILDSVTTNQKVFSDEFTLTVKDNCVFEREVAFHGKTQLQGGTFQGGIQVEPGEQALDLLADGYAFADANDNAILNVSDVSIQNRNVKVVEHTCQYHHGKCACGRICDHAGKVDSTGYCTFCHALVEAFEISGKRYTSLENALAAAKDGDTITLRGPLEIENKEPIEISKNIILNLHGFTLSKSREEALLCILGSNVAITNGTVQNTYSSKPHKAVKVGNLRNTNAKLTLNNVTLEGSTDGRNRGEGLSILTGNEAVVTSGTFTGGIYTEGTLTMSGGSADRLELGYNSDIRVTLSGGSFDSIQIENGADYQSLLAAGYAYQKKDGALVKLSEMKENTAVTVVKCSHPDAPSGGNVCPYCGYAAAVTKTDGSISYYPTAAAAIAAADGGTVKLLADAGEITISSPLKLDLNGKTAAKLTVTGDVTLASLLPEGYAFKSGSTWISDLSSKELTNVSMAKIPIKSMNYPTEMSMTYGGAGTLLVKVAKETGTGAVNFQWYKVEDGKETAVGSATAKNQFDLAAQNLSAGQHTFRFLATCDGYKKMSQDIAVTVQTANISASLITPPTAQENLTYTGQEQALITAGSVTDYGTMQYSLTENGTYSQTIPTGTDAGAYTVWYRVIGDENHNNTTPASVAVSIGKKPLTITGVTAASKPYDGTTNADISSVTFDNVTLNRGTDYTVTASFDDASAGNGKNITATVTLMGQTAKNYALEQSSFTTTGNITKAAAPDFTRKTALTIVNDCEKTYTVTLPALPTLETPKEYGALTYEIGEIKLNDGYYTSGAKVENGKLTLPIQKNDVETTGSVGTVTVVIKSTNYEDITLTVNISAANKRIPTVTAPTINTLTYNGAEQALVTAGRTTGGTMLYRLDGSEWSEQIPTAKNAGEYTVWYKVQGNAEYADVAEQSLTVTVAKKAVTVTALDKSAYTGSTAPDLSSPEANKDYKVEGLVGADTLSGTVTLAYAQTPDMSKTGEAAINITGTLSNDNYEITYVPGTLTVSKQSSSGGGSSSGGSGSGGGSSSGGSGNSGSSGNTSQPDTGKPDKPDSPVTGETKPVKPDKNGNVSVDNSSVQSAIDKAKQDAKKNGTAENGIAVTVPITSAAGQAFLNVTIKAQTLDLLVKENVQQFTVAIDHLVSVNIGLDTLKQLDTVSKGGDIILRADKVDALRSTEAKAAIGTRPAYDLSLVYLSGGKETPIANLNGHTISVRLPYTLAKGEQTGNLYAVYVDNAGKVEWITRSSYDASQKAVVFETGHFSVYGVGYKTFVPAFTDITGHWAADNILFVASRGLLSGTSDTTFSPNSGMTRGMFVTALGRLAGINPDSYKTGKFTDVKANAYYAPYVNWAAQTGIVEGVTATTFAPDTNINREQMAVIMKNYAAKLGYDLPQTLKAVTFADNTQISSWAKDAVKSMQQAGILAGKNGNKFDPKGIATRAEVATVLRRFVEIVIDPQAANGWQQNDSGQWNYYRNGEPVKGWLSDDQKWYWLDKTTGMMFAGGWKQIDGKWYYFHTDGTMAVNTTIDGHTIGSDGARK